MRNLAAPFRTLFHDVYPFRQLPERPRGRADVYDMHSGTVGGTFVNIRGIGRAARLLFLMGADRPGRGTSRAWSKVPEGL